MPASIDPEVWIVDDSLSVRRALGAALDSAGIRVRTFASARDCLNAFDPTRSPFLIVDHAMPELTGLELVRRLRERARLNIVAISGGGHESLREEYLAAGALAMLPKPVDSNELLTLIQNCR